MSPDLPRPGLGSDIPNHSKGRAWASPAWGGGLGKELLL